MPERCAILDAERRHTRRALLVGSCALMAAAVWAARPLQPGQVQPPPIAPPPVSGLDTPARFVDAHVFDVQLDAPRPAPVVQAPAPAPARLRVSLLAISRAPGPHSSHEAWVYDPAQDVVLCVRAGDSIAGRRIQRIWEGGLEVADAQGPRRLLLDESVGPSSPGGAR